MRCESRTRTKTLSKSSFTFIIMSDSDATDLNRFKDLFLSKKHTDVTIHVKGENKTTHIKSHKALLALSSLVFQDLLITNPGSELTIEEPDIKNFQILIKFIYTHEVDFSKLKSKDVIIIIQLAIKYEVHELVEYSVEAVFKQKHLTELCCKKCLADYFNFAFKENIEIMIKPCLEMISRNTASFCKDDVFLSLSPEALKTIVEQDDLNISEIDLYLSVLSWAEHKYFVDNNEDKPVLTKKHDVPLSLQMMENKTFHILKVEHSDSLQLEDETENMYFKALSELNRETEADNENKPKDFWIMIRSILDEADVIKNIRFLAFDPTEFAFMFAESKILTVDELSDIFLNHNSTSLQPLSSGLSNNRTPRQAQNNNPKLCVHAIVMFDFVSTHKFFETQLPFPYPVVETFRIVSEQPIMLMAIFLKGKERSSTSKNKYDDCLHVDFYKKTPDLKDRQLFATAHFHGRRNYEEALTMTIEYDFCASVNPLLHRGSEIEIEIIGLSVGAYVCGLTRSLLSDANPFIVPKEEIQKQLTVGFGFCFNMEKLNK
ncbi:uncharacterized protein LOC113363452 isoform X2 [Ctenocephalides felis]|uniref:uncharacterized protein LOC113363452 isoform X2 n=1 Tax=Ctenocephalides felis TaxID=7515 RepID=UPI000E6E4F2F|nr:uncharacterized protein LOC113363452 isoform X2 [Ctenocephalides felis]